MLRKRVLFVLLIFACSIAFAVSCAKKEEESSEESSGPGNRAVQYIEEEVSIGIFFDAEGTKRSITLGKDEKEFTAYIIIKLPEYLEINAIEFQLELPEGVVITNDKYLAERTIVMGHFDDGISEAFPCATGPQIVLHELTLLAESDLADAVISIVKHRKSQQVAVTKCEEGYPIIKVAAVPPTWRA